MAGIAFLGALVFGITGFGAALVTIPLATHLVPLPTALAIFVLVDLACALSVGFENPRNAVRAEWTRLVPMIAVGTAVGVTLLVNLPRQAATVALGLFVCGYALYALRGSASEKAPVSPRWAWLAGFAGGITDPTSGLMHYGHRWYDPTTGRYGATAFGEMLPVHENRVGIEAALNATPMFVPGATQFTTGNTEPFSNVTTEPFHKWSLHRRG